MSSEVVPPRVRSLADDLRARDDTALHVLLSARPDLLNPVPSDVASLAARAASRPSVQRVLDQSDLFHLQVIDALCLLPDPVDISNVVALVGADATLTTATVSLLGAQALVYGDDSGLSVVRTLRESVGPPAGLGPPVAQLLGAYGPARVQRLVADLDLPVTDDAADAARHVTALFEKDDALRDLLSGAPPEAVEAARSLAAGPPAGRLERAAREVDAATARTPVEWLLARGLVIATDDNTVVLPREVALHLRGGRVHPTPQPHPPELELTWLDPDQVERAAAGGAFTLVRLVEELLELWSTEPPKALRAGGLGVRERARAAAALDLDEEMLSLLVEVAHIAGLLDAATDVDEVWLPTSSYDRWLDLDSTSRWLALVEGWLTTTRVPGLAGTSDARGRTLAALGPDLNRSLAPQVRAATLDALAEPCVATARAGAVATAESVVARLAWYAPRRGGRLRDDIVRWTLREAEWIGLTGRGALSQAARHLLAGDEERARAVLAKHLPKPLDHVLLQADLTAVAPGPLASALAQRLRLVADVESTGGATVYRFSESSVRRGLDAGLSSDDVLKLLGNHSRTPVPQPLTYLVQDIARRHGQVRVGGASSYLRSDDEALVAEIVADRRLAQLRLRRLAPTVLAAQAPVEVALTRLRHSGYVPAAEGPDGDVVVRRPNARRAQARPVVPVIVPERANPRPELVAAAVRAVRAGDRAATAVKRVASARGDESGLRPPQRRSMADVLATLHEAVATGEPLWVGYVNAEGHASQRVVEPISVQGGYLSAYDHLRDEVRTFSVHRITGISTLDE